MCVDSERRSVISCLRAIKKYSVFSSHALKRPPLERRYSLRGSASLIVMDDNEMAARVIGTALH
jgi:hypothetical protein